MNPQPTVLKFGGTSMSDHQTWAQVLEIIQGYERPVVVVSATARTTRMLLEAAEAAAAQNVDQRLEIVEAIRNRHEGIIHDFIKGEDKHLFIEKAMLQIENCMERLNGYLNDVEADAKISLKSRDRILSIGEQISSYLLTQCAQSLGLKCTYINARWVIKTDSTFGKAAPDERSIFYHSDIIKEVMEESSIPIMGGFYGENEFGELTTLGFEGSDYTASLIGAAIDAKQVEIWTDVSGVYTSDPRYIEDASPIQNLSYSEATEMAYYGAKVLHPSTLKPVQEKGIPVLVKNMFSPTDEGTMISVDSSGAKDVLALSFEDDICIVTANAPQTVMGYAFLRKVFEQLEYHLMPVELVTTTEASVSIAVQYSDDVKRLIKYLKEFSTVSLEEGLGLIRVIGTTHSTMNEMYQRMFEHISEVDIRMMAFTKDKKNLNLLVAESDLIPTAQQIHTHCFS